jgi:hypothetical protein
MLHALWLPEITIRQGQVTFSVSEDSAPSERVFSRHEDLAWSKKLKRLEMARFRILQGLSV